MLNQTYTKEGKLSLKNTFFGGCDVTRQFLGAWDQLATTFVFSALRILFVFVQGYQLSDSRCRQDFLKNRF